MSFERIIRLFRTTVLVFFTLTHMASSDTFDTKPLFSKGAWSVELTHDVSDGGLWCSAETTNREGQTFSITAFDSRSMALFVFDGRWNIAERPIEFLVDIDRSRWTMAGHGDGIGVSLSMDDVEKATRFLRQLMAGNAVAVKNSNERRLANFSLSGSYAAISNLLECWEQITANSDPFSSQDPFTGVSNDPFN